MDTNVCAVSAMSLLTVVAVRAGYYGRGRGSCDDASVYG